MSTEKSVPVLESETEPVLLREHREGIEILTLNRSRSRNSLSIEMISAIREALRSIAGEASVRVVLLASTGPAFCAGHDLKELAARRKDEDGGRLFYEKVMSSCSSMMQELVQLPQPIIAVVQGVATAAGCQLVASCDLAVASSSARFATPGVDIGLFCSTPMVALSRNVAPKHALEMLLTGELISAEEAFRIGLVNRIAQAGNELQESLDLAALIAKKSPQAVRIGKQAFYKQAELGLEDAYRLTAEIMVKNLLKKDAEEGICAFIEKRAPHWASPEKE